MNINYTYNKLLEWRYIKKPIFYYQVERWPHHYDTK